MSGWTTNDINAARLTMLADRTSDREHDYRMLSLRIRALNSRLKSRKRDDLAQRETVRTELETVRAQRDALEITQQ
jgi:uncharacterized protein (DUF342 family)